MPIGPASSETPRRTCTGKPRTIATVTANAQATGNTSIIHSTSDVAAANTNVADVADVAAPVRQAPRCRAAAVFCWLPEAERRSWNVQSFYLVAKRAKIFNYAGGCLGVGCQEHVR